MSFIPSFGAVNQIQTSNGNGAFSGSSNLTFNGSTLALSGAFNPGSDNTSTIGSSALRFVSVSGIVYNVFNANTDTKAIAALGTSGLLLGAGGTSLSPDVRFFRSAAGTPGIDNNASGAITTATAANTLHALAYDTSARTLGPITTGLTGVCRIHAGTSQSYANALNTVQQFDTVDISQGGTIGGSQLLTPSSSPSYSRITINATGVYRVDFSGPFFTNTVLSASAQGTVGLAIRLNGGASLEYAYYNNINTSAGTYTISFFKASGTFTRSFSAGDYVEMLVYQTSGSSISSDVSDEGRWAKLTVTQVI